MHHLHDCAVPFDHLYNTQWKIYLKPLAKSLSLIVLGAGFYLYKRITLFGEFKGGAVGLGLVHVAPSEMLLILIHL